MIRFTNDYSEGCHPSILEAMAATNTEGNPGYSTDPHSARARRLIQAAIGRTDADVHILVGGTQTNATAIAAFLRPYEAVIAATSAHICVHETGAIEATGHKCIVCPAADGKLTADAVRAAGCGMVSPACDADALADNLVQLCRMSPDRRAELGRCAKVYYLENYRRNLLLKKLEAFLLPDGRG